MNLKTKTEEFLQNVLVMRSNAINEAVQRELQTKHEPYRAQMVAARDKIISNEKQILDAKIAQLKKEHDGKISTCVADFEKAIQTNKDEVTRSAEANVKAEYDKFIEGVAAVADNIKTN